MGQKPFVIDTQKPLKRTAVFWPFSHTCMNCCHVLDPMEGFLSNSIEHRTLLQMRYPSCKNVFFAGACHVGTHMLFTCTCTLISHAERCGFFQFLSLTKAEFVLDDCWTTEPIDVDLCKFSQVVIWEC